MDTERLVSITISVPKSYRDKLRKIIAHFNLENLDDAMNISRLGREIFRDYLKNLTADV